METYYLQPNQLYQQRQLQLQQIVLESLFCLTFCNLTIQRDLEVTDVCWRLLSSLPVNQTIILKE